MSVDDSAPHTVSLHVDITAALSPLPDTFAGLRVAPSFRFALFDGRRVTTEAVGGAGWELVSLPHSGEGAIAASAAPKTAPPAKPVTAEKGAKGAPAGPSVADAAANGALVRHRTIVDGFIANADAARMIGASPALFFFCNVAVSATAPAATAPEKGGKGAASVAVLNATQRPWAFWIPLDASPLLLDEHSAVSAVHGSRDALLRAVNAAGRDEVDITALLGAPLPACEFPAPSIFSFLSVHVRVAAASAPTVPAPEPAPAPAPAPAKGGKAPATASKGAALAAPVAPPAPTTVAVIPPRLLSHGVRAAVNPLRLVLHGASALPGLSLPEGSDPRHVAEYFSPDAFEAQRKHGSGTYAVAALPFAAAHARGAEFVTLPDAPPLSPITTAGAAGSSSSSSKHTRATVGSLGLEDVSHGLRAAFPPPRCVFTPSLPPGRSAAWQTTTVICAGAVAPDRLRESFESSGLCVRVHDRDCDAYEAVQSVGRSAARGRDAAPPTPTPASTQVAATPSPVSTPVKGGKATPAAAAAAAVSAGAAPPPVHGPPLGPLVAALLPRSWPWPRLSGARLGVFESMLAGAVKHPRSSSGAQLVPWWTVETGGAAAVATAAPPPATAVASPKGKAPAAAPPAATPAAGSALPPPDIFLLDALLIAEVMARLLRADDVHPHGLATLRLDRLLSAKSAADVAVAAIRSQAVPLSAAHRASKPKTFEPTHLLSRGQAMLATPGDYCGSGACVKVSASLAAPLQTDTRAALSSTLATSELLVSELARAGIALSTDFSITSGTLGARATAAPGAIERLVLIFPYTDDALMLQVITAVAAVNSRAVPAAASLQAHVFSAEERAAIAAHELDVVTGVHVTDGLQRIFILEGLGGVGRGMEDVRLALPPRPDPSDASLLLLANALVRFQERLYPDTGLALRSVRLGRPLADIAADKGVYNAAVSPDALRAAVSALCALATRAVSTLAMARQLGAAVWPPLPGLDDLELKHGAALSLVDVYGRLHPAAHALGETSTRLAEVLDFVTAQRPAADNDENLLAKSLARSAVRAADDDGPASPTLSARRRARSPRATVSIRDLMAPGELKRTAVDFIAENARSVSALSETVAVARRSELLASHGPAALAGAELLRTGKTSDTLGVEPPGGQVFLYSSQKLNTGEWARKLQRDRLVADRGATFSRSATAEFGALRISLDPTDEEVRAAALAANVSAWKTPRGFVYPQAGSRREDLAHAKAVSASAFLAEPFVDAAEAGGPTPVERARMAEGRPDFRALVHPSPLGKSAIGHMDASTGKGTFGFVAPPSGGGGGGGGGGGVGAPTSANVGSAFFKSVFLGGKGLREEADAAAIAEREAWSAKVITAPRFLPYAPHDATKMERHASLLRSPPQKLSLRRVVEGDARVPPLSPAPPSILAGDTFTPANTLDKLLRAGAGVDAGLHAADFRATAEPDIVRGVFDAVHVPLLAAGRRVHASPGERTMSLLPTHVSGVNTDAVET